METTPYTWAPISLKDLVEQAEFLTRTDRKYVVPTHDASQILAELPESTRILTINGTTRFTYETGATTLRFHTSRSSKRKPMGHVASWTPPCGRASIGRHQYQSSLRLLRHCAENFPPTNGIAFSSATFRKRHKGMRLR